MYACAHTYITEVVITFYLKHTGITNQFIAAERARATF